MENWVKDVRYILMPSRHPVKGFEKEYYAAYATWRAAWEKFYQEIKVDHPLDSDAFVIPDEMGVVFYKNECVGLCAYTYGTLNNWDTMKDMGWFRSWSPEAFAKLRQITEDCMIGSQFSISPKFTGKEQIVRWKDIMFLYLFLRLENASCSVMAGHLNVARGMDKAGGKDNGATIFDEHHHFNFHGIPLASQLVAYEKKVVREYINSHGLRPLAQDLWAQMIDLRSEEMIYQTKKDKQAA